MDNVCVQIMSGVIFSRFNTQKYILCYLRGFVGHLALGVFFVILGVKFWICLFKLNDKN